MGNKLTRLRTTLTMFNESVIVEYFRNSWKRGFSHRVAHRGEHVAEFEIPPTYLDLPSHFMYNGMELDTSKFLNDHWTTGLVVLHVPDALNFPTKAVLLYEKYFRGNDATSKCISWSMGKSVVGALVGIALKQGKIKSLEDKVTDYLPEFKKSGYDSVTLKNVLQMSSGVRFTEDYGNFFSDINRMARTLALGYSANGLAASLKHDCEQGTIHHYCSMDTQVLGAVLSQVVGPEKTLTDYLEDNIWSKAGFEDDAFWLLDNDTDKMELAFGTLNARTRDYARLGWLYLNKGRSPLDGSEIVDEEWVVTSVTPDAPHLQPGLHEEYNFWGYGYQIWVLGKDDQPNEVAGDYAFVGVYNQFVYVSPRHGIVIAKNSAYPGYDKDENPSEAKSIACFRAIANHMADKFRS